MNCPVCSKAMTAENLGGVSVDICRTGCKGLWFDWSELTKLDEPNEGVGQALQEALHYPRTNDANRPRLNCPKCRMPMTAHKYDAIEQVNIDECYNCRGIFVDSGELQEIRGHLVSRDEEDAYLASLVASSPVQKKGQAELAELARKRDAAMRSWTRFLRLSYWVTGK